MRPIRFAQPQLRFEIGNQGLVDLTEPCFDLPFRFVLRDAVAILQPA